MSAQPTNLVPDAGPGTQGFFVLATNVGAADATGPITLTDALPAGLVPETEELLFEEEECEVSGQLVTCAFDRVIHPGGHIGLFIPVAVAPAVDGVSLEDEVMVEGGGAAATATVDTQVGSPPPSFGFLSGPRGLAGILGEADGSAVSEAGVRPHQLTLDMGFPSELQEGLAGLRPANAGWLHDLSVDLPPGMVFDPSATPRCRDIELELGVCPAASRIGSIEVVTFHVTLHAEPAALYNVVPPPGSASDFGFHAALAEGAVTGHLLGSLRAGDYGLGASEADIPAIYPILGIRLQLWGNPSEPAFDSVRGGPVERQDTPLIVMPSACGPLGMTASVDSWEDRGAFVSRSAPIEDLSGDPIEVDGCSRLGFAPSISVQPTTSTADSPAGVELEVEAPQHLGPEGSTTSSLKGAEITLPPGLVVNPATAAGAAACSPAQIGLTTSVGNPEARFDDSAVTCPDAAKVGTVEISTPLLTDEHEVGKRTPHPLTGSIYLAQPRQNPFGSLFALYAAIDDPETGIVVKLAGEVVADPATGQLTATFGGIPQLPFEDFKLRFFEGPRAVLRTPALCGSYSSRAGFTPWSGTARVQGESHFSIAASPSGGTCAIAPGRLANAPRLDGGSISPAAGRYSPFVLDLSRSDDSQELGGLEVNLPAGLVGRLAGTAQCSDAALVAASAKSGGEEKVNPSCPAASRLGRVVVGLGAGSRPYETEGGVYLAGPYKGAPLSLAVVTAAAAGPFDLGTVVVRAAVFVDPTTGRLTVESDPLPSMLEGVPLDVRSLRMELDKPDLIRNPTSCEPMAITGSATSTLGQVAPLLVRFQVGDCAALRFRPKLSMRLFGAPGRNGHPTLRAVLRGDPDGAAVERARFAFPGGELLDLEHVHGLCPSNVPLGSCPAASRIGSVRLFTPSLDDPLEGPVYVRVPSRRLPDLVAEVRSEGFRFLLHGRVINAKGRLGVALERLPDIPLSRAILTLDGGRRGILVNSRSICGRGGQVEARFTAHNGRRREQRVPVQANGCR